MNIDLKDWPRKKINQICKYNLLRFLKLFLVMIYLDKNKTYVLFVYNIIQLYYSSCICIHSFY